MYHTKEIDQTSIRDFDIVENQSLGLFKKQMKNSLKMLGNSSVSFSPEVHIQTPKGSHLTKIYTQRVLSTKQKFINERENFDKKGFEGSGKDKNKFFSGDFIDPYFQSKLIEYDKTNKRKIRRQKGLNEKYVKHIEDADINNFNEFKRKLLKKNKKTVMEYLQYKEKNSLDIEPSIVSKDYLKEKLSYLNQNIVARANRSNSSNSHGDSDSRPMSKVSYKSSMHKNSAFNQKILENTTNKYMQNSDLNMSGRK